MNTKTSTLHLAEKPAAQRTSEAPLQTEVIKFSELHELAIQAWKRWSQQSSFHSPYFHPSFTECVNAVRSDVHVLVGRSLGEIVALFPFQYGRRNLIEPAGGAVNDYQAVLSDAERPVSIVSLLRAADVGRLQFHSWLNPSADLGPHVYGEVEASIADFSQGQASFLNELKSQSSTIARHPQKTRKLMREIGPLRLDLNCQDPSVLDWVIAKKREKYANSGVVDFFGVPWTRNLMKKIFNTQTVEFGGLLSALYAGDHLVAAHFGMRRGSTLHYWYPVYDRSYRVYSPGTQLFLEIVNRAQELEIQKIDFGYGEDPYKTKLTNRRFKVARGCIDFNRLRSSYKKQVDHLVSKVKSSPAKQPLKRIVRMFMPGAGQPRV